MIITHKNLRKVRSAKNREGRGFTGGIFLSDAAAFGRTKRAYERSPEAAEQRARRIYESLRPQIAAFPIKRLPPQDYVQCGRL